MTSQRTFVGVSALLFAASSALTIVWCASMQSMGGMPMPGGWTMSMTWMRMPGHSWPGSAATFLGMWMVMMVAMMLPSLVPMLRHCRAAVAAIVSIGYFVVWALIGIGIFIAGVALAFVEMRNAFVSRTVPITGALIVLIAGAFQFTSWKARRLSGCRAVPSPTTRIAFRHGIHLGLRCVSCCANLTAILLVIGVMDLRAMAVVTVAMTAERLSRSGARVARATGALTVAAGIVLIVRIMGLSLLLW
ncbi:MAG TPA: DUF2182 domain-containing protein [Thermoanaerobaculia bacterium]